MKNNLKDKKKELRKKIHLTRPPRLEGKVKNAMMNPERKAKKTEFYSSPMIGPWYIASESGYEEDDACGYNEESEY